MFDGGGLVAKSYPTLATPWVVARQATLSMGFSRQEYWSALPFPFSKEMLIFPLIKGKYQYFVSWEPRFENCFQDSL